MCSVSPAQQVLFLIWMFLSLPKIFKSMVIDKHGFVLAMEISYLNLGVTSEMLNRLIQVMSAVTTYNVLYTETVSNSRSCSERIRNRITISLLVDHFNKTILHVLSTETCQWTVILVQLKVTCEVVSLGPRNLSHCHLQFGVLNRVLSKKLNVKYLYNILCAFSCLYVWHV